MDNNCVKQSWQTPELTSYGRVEELTAQNVKYMGYNDGFSYDPDGPEGPQGPSPIGSRSIS